jgi:hypothetical protein
MDYGVTPLGPASGTVRVPVYDDDLAVTYADMAFVDASLDGWLAMVAGALDADPALADVRAAVARALADRLAPLYADGTGAAGDAAGDVAAARAAFEQAAAGSLRWDYAVDVAGLGPDLVEVEVRWNGAEPVFAALAAFATAWPVLSAVPDPAARAAAVRDRVDAVAAALGAERWVVDLTDPATVTVYARDDVFPTVDGVPPGPPKDATLDGDDGWRAATYAAVPGPALRLGWSGLDLDTTLRATASVRTVRVATPDRSRRTAAAFVSRSPWVAFADAVAPLLVVPHLAVTASGTAGETVAAALAPFGTLAARTGGGALRVTGAYAFEPGAHIPMIDGTTDVTSADTVARAANAVAAAFVRWLADVQPPADGTLVLGVSLAREGGPALTVTAIDVPVPESWWPG